MKIFNDDCLDVLLKMEEESIDLVLCDPPYKTTKRGTSGTMKGFFLKKEGKNGNGGFKENNLDINDYLPLLFKVMKPKAHGYLMCNDKNLVDFHTAIKKCGFKIFKTLIWAKNNVVANQYYMSSHEYIIFFRKGKAKMINNRGTRSVLSYNNPKPKIHPSEKPVDMLEALIRNSSEKEDVVLDFAMGSGSTCIAAINSGRKFIGIEKDKEYFDIAEKRIKLHLSKAQKEI
jgi:site-specific DNA-methyltransferase (adenine-specific)